MTPHPQTPVQDAAVILARKSQARVEADTETVDRQFEDATYYAGHHKPPLIVAAKLFDLESGYKDKSKNARPGLREALRMIEEGEAKHLVVARLDRLTRQGPLAFLQILKRIKDVGGTLHILDVPGLGQLDTSGVIGVGILGLLASVASEWSERTSTNVKRAELASATAGRRHGGSRPYGWHQAPKRGEEPCPSCGVMMGQIEVKGRRLSATEVCPVEAGVIREAVDRILAQPKGTSVRALSLDFNRRGIRTARGKEWSPTTLTKLLHSPALSGKRTHLGTEYDGVFPPILTPEEHGAVRAEITREGSTGALIKQSLLTDMGVLFCQCGASMRQANPTPGKFTYRCAGYYDTTGKWCGSVTAMQKGVDATIVARLLWWKKHHVLEQSESELDLLVRQIEEDKESAKELVEARYVFKTLDEDSFRAVYDPLKQRIEDTEHLISASRQVVVHKDSLEPDKGQSLEEWWESKNIHEQRAVVKHYVKKVTVLPSPQGIKSGPKFNPDRVECDFTSGVSEGTGLKVRLS